MDTGDLENRAEEALAEGAIEDALDFYQQLEIRFNHEPSWSRQVAHLHQKLGNEAECVKALCRAGERCTARREPLKAIAAAKMALAIDPAHKPSRTVLDRALGPRPQPISHDELVWDLEMPLDPEPMPVIPLARRSSKTGLLPPIGADPDTSDPNLPEVPLFSRLSNAQIEEIVADARVLHVRKDETLFRQGDEGQSLFVIVEGSVQVFQDGEPRQQIATLSEGEFFGEVAVYTARPRGATIEAAEDTELLEISRGVLVDLIQKEPHVLTVLLKFLRERIVENLYRSSPLFTRFSDEDRRLLAKHFILMDLEEETVLIEEGTLSGGIYLLVDGSLEVTRKTDYGVRVLATLSPGHICGEISAITKLKAVATVRATQPTMVFKLPEHDLREAITAHPKLLAFATELASERMTQIGFEIHGRMLENRILFF